MCQNFIPVCMLGHGGYLVSISITVTPKLHTTQCSVTRKTTYLWCHVVENKWKYSYGAGIKMQRSILFRLEWFHVCDWYQNAIYFFCLWRVNEMFKKQLKQLQRSGFLMTNAYHQNERNISAETLILEPSICIQSKIQMTSRDVNIKKDILKDLD